MEKIEEILNEMDKLLDQLLENAKKLLDVSQRVIEEDELAFLQSHQQELLAKLLDKDEEYYKIAENQKRKHQFPIQDHIERKLKQFQTLNTTFIDNIASTHGLIQFQKAKNNKK